jgi:uncharacterized protein
MTYRLARHLLLALLLLLISAPALAKPALWVVQHDHTTIYLFGTVHLLPDDTGWRDATLDRALAGSDKLYIELTDDDQANMLALVMQYGMDLSHPLSTLISPEELQQVNAAAVQAGLPNGAQTLSVMRPWLAALMLATAPLLKAGLDPEHGVDKQLKAQMIAAGKPVFGLETSEQQIRLLADMPQAMQLSFLRSTLRDVDKGPAELKKLIDAWKNGDTDAIARVENEDLAQSEPALYQRLLVQRNQNWAARIGDLLRTPGTVFIAVGAAHLAGPDSVQAQLQKIGVEAKRE